MEFTPYNIEYWENVKTERKTYYFNGGMSKTEYIESIEFYECKINEIKKGENLDIKKG